MSVDEQNSNGFHERPNKIVKDAIEQAAEPQQHATDVLPADVKFVPRHGPRQKPRELPPSAGCARTAEAHDRELGDLIKLPGSTPNRPAGGSGYQSSRTRVAGRAESVPSRHPEFRTEVTVAGMTVTGVLSATARPPAGSIEINGDVHRLSCDHALELVDALLLVVTRMDLVLEERYSITPTMSEPSISPERSDGGSLSYVRTQAQRAAISRCGTRRPPSL
jgi:hypothetical protein